MNQFIFGRTTHSKNALLRTFNRFRRIQNFSSTKNSSSSSDDEKKSVEKKKSNEALEKLNNLLKTMIEEDVSYSSVKLNMARPTIKKEKNVKHESKSKSYDKQLVKAVKNVAESLGGDTKKTESELLIRLLSTPDDKSTNLSELVKGMKIDQEQSQNEPSRAQQIRQAKPTKTSEEKLKGHKHIEKTFKTRKTEIVMEKIDLFGSDSLGIFSSKDSSTTEGVENKTWNKLYERDLKLAVTHPPNNYFQQLIQWTEQGKIWKFPIDNEQDLDEEKKIYFIEHVFLEKHLEPWCPPKGPLRHFMELVCVGLSKNPYLTVESKKQHILWFRNYFEEKKQLLKETGVIQDAESLRGQKGTEQIEQ